MDKEDLKAIEDGKLIDTLKEESLTESMDTDWRLIYSGTDGKHNYGDKVTELHQWDKDKILDHLIDGGSQFTLNDGTEVEIEFDDGEWDEVWPQILRQFKNGKLNGKLSISETLTEAKQSKQIIVEVDGVYYIYIDGKLVGTFGDKKSLEDAGYSLNNLYAIIEDNMLYNKDKTWSSSIAMVRGEVKRLANAIGAGEIEVPYKYKIRYADGREEMLSEDISDKTRFAIYDALDNAGIHFNTAGNEFYFDDSEDVKKANYIISKLIGDNKVRQNGFDLIISEALHEDNNRGDYIECPICHQDYYEDEMTNMNGYGLVCGDCALDLIDDEILDVDIAKGHETWDGLFDVADAQTIADDFGKKVRDENGKIFEPRFKESTDNKKVDSLDEAYDETLEDYICRRLREEDVNYDYDYDITWTFDTIDDYNRGDDIICNIVGDEYEGDRNSLSIDVWALVDDGESFNEDTTFEELLAEGLSGYNWDTTRLQDLVYYYMSDDDFIDENKLKNLLKKQLATEGTPVGESSKELKVFNDKVMSILDNYYEDVDNNYFDESLNEGRPYKPLYNKIIELLKEKDVDYVLENTRTGARFVQGNNDKATCISFVSEGANDDESITVRCYYKDNKGNLTNNIIIAREKDFDKIKNALFSNPSYEGTPVNINLR